MTELDREELIIRATIARALFDELVQGQKFDQGQALYLLPSMLNSMLPFTMPRTDQG
jgi:hypothetical protein